jgi:hypothetical protein
MIIGIKEENTLTETLDQVENATAVAYIAIIEEIARYPKDVADDANIKVLREMEAMLVAIHDTCADSWNAGWSLDHAWNENLRQDV